MIGLDILHNKKLLKYRFNQKERVKIYKKIASNFENGLDVLTSLKKLYARYKKNKDFKQYILKDWIRTIDAGKTFPVAIKSWIPNIEYMLISSGDGKSLLRGLNEAISIGQAMTENKKTIINGVAFPTLLLVLLFGLFVGFRLFLSSALELVIPVNKWPSDSQTLYYFSDFLLNNIITILMSFGILGLVVYYSLNKLTGKFRQILDYIPPYSIYKEYQSYAFLISLSSLMQAGTSVLESLQKLKSGSNVWLKSYITKMIAKMNRGQKPTDALNVSLFNKELMGDIDDYSDSKEFDETLYILSKESLKESTETIKVKMNIVKFGMIFIIALSVCFLLYGVFGVVMAASDYAALSK